MCEHLALISVMSENVIDDGRTDHFAIWLFLKHFEILITKISGNAVESDNSRRILKFESKLL